MKSFYITAKVVQNWTLWCCCRNNPHVLPNPYPVGTSDDAPEHTTRKYAQRFAGFICWKIKNKFNAICSDYPCVSSVRQTPFHTEQQALTILTVCVKVINSNLNFSEPPVRVFASGLWIWTHISIRFPFIHSHPALPLTSLSKKWFSFISYDGEQKTT